MCADIDLACRRIRDFCDPFALDTPDLRPRLIPSVAFATSDDLRGVLCRAGLVERVDPSLDLVVVE